MRTKKRNPIIIAVSLIIALTITAGCSKQSTDTQSNNLNSETIENMNNRSLDATNLKLLAEDGYIYNGYSSFGISRLHIIDDSHIESEPIIINEYGTYTVDEAARKSWNYHIYSSNSWEMNDGDYISYMFKTTYVSENNSFILFSEANQEWIYTLALMNKELFDKYAKNGFNSNYFQTYLAEDCEIENHINFWNSIDQDSFEDIESITTTNNSSGWPLNATNCWSQLADGEGYVFGLFDGSFCAMKKKDNSHILAFRVRINDDISYEINYNTDREYYYEQYDSAVWSMNDGISQVYIYDTEYADKDNQYIMFADKNDNEDLFLMSKTMFENYIKFLKLCEDGDAEWVDDWGSSENNVIFWDYIKTGNISKDSFIALVSQVFGSEAANELL